MFMFVKNKFLLVAIFFFKLRCDISHEKRTELHTGRVDNDRNTYRNTLMVKFIY